MYGAGVCGITFFRQLLSTKYCDLVLWVDKNAATLKSEPDCYGCTFPVSEVDELYHRQDYDFLLIAISKKEIVSEVYSSLIEDYQIPAEKIITVVHEIITHDTVYGTYKNEYTALLQESELLQKVFPNEVIKSNELSVMPRYLLCKDIVNGINNEANISLYARTILAQGDIFTKDNYFSNRDKSSVKDFVSSLRKLVHDMQENDFNRQNYIPMVHGNRIILDGQHRIATSLALEKELWTRYYPDNVNYGDGFGFEWFQKNGFHTNDQLRILRAYADTVPNCGLIILFGTVMDHWEYLQAQFAKVCQLVGYVELDFTKNYLGFENLVREIYQDPLWQNVQIHLKSSLLKLSPLKLRVLLVSNENDPTQNIYETIRYTKLKLRDSLYFNSEPNAGVVVHASDSFEEFVLMKNILLSPNNQNALTRCTFRNYRKYFVDRLSELKNILYEKKIRIEDICVVGGSILEIFGLRTSDDLDIIIKSTYHSKYGTDAQKWNDFIDVCPPDRIVDENNQIWKNDLLIDDDNFHFMFFGIKFMNIELLKSKKKHDGREKDLNDVKLINLFLEYAAHFDDKYVLRQQIDRELHLRRFL